MAQNDPLYQEALALRADPRVQRVYDKLSPDAKAMFEGVLGEQNNEVNQQSGGWKNPLSKIPFVHPTSEYAPTETNIFGDIFDRPRAAVAAAASNLVRPITRDPYMSPVQAFQKPRQVPELGDAQAEKFYSWAADKPMALTVPLDMMRQPLSWGSNIFGNPGNFIPLGLAERFGAKAVSMIPGAKQAATSVAGWAAKNAPTLGKPLQAAAEAVANPQPIMRPAPKAGALPEDTAAVARKAQIQAEYEAFKAQQAAKQPASPMPQQAPIDMPDDAAAYQQWLEQNLPKVPESQRPPAEVPLHPFEDAVPMADAFNLKENVILEPNGQMVMKGGSGGELGPQVFKPGKPAVPAPQLKGQMEFPFARAPEQAPIDFSPFELPPQGPAPQPPKKWAKAVPGEQMVMPGGEGGKLGPEIFGKKAVVSIEIPIDKAAAEAKIAELRAKKQGGKPAPAAIINPQPPVQVMKLLKENQPGSLEQLVQNFGKLPNPKNQAEMVERMAMRKDLEARAKKRGQELKLNKGIWELRNPEAEVKVPAKKGRALQPAQAKPMPAEKLSPLEAGILARAQQKVSPLQQGIQKSAPKPAPKPAVKQVAEPAKPVLHPKPLTEREARKASFRAEIERRRQALFGEMKQAKGKEAVQQGLKDLAPAVEGKGIKSAADKKIDELLARMPDEEKIAADPKGKFIEGQKYISTKEGGEPLVYKGMNKDGEHVFIAPDGSEVAHAPVSVDAGDPRNFKSAKKFIAFRESLRSPTAEPFGEGLKKQLTEAWKQAQKIPIKENPLIEDLHPMESGVPKKTAMGEALKKSKKGLGNKGQAVAPIPEGEDVAKAAAEGAKKEVLKSLEISSLPEGVKEQLRELYAQQKAGKPVKELVARLNISKFPKEQQAQIRELFKGKESKLSAPAISNDATRARAENMEHLPIAQEIWRHPAGQVRAEVTKMGSDAHARLLSIAKDPTVAGIEKVKAVNQLGLEKLQKVSSELGGGLQALKMKTEVSKDQMDALKLIIDQLRADPTLSRKATQIAIKELTRPFPDLEGHVSVPAIYKFIFRNFITSGWKTITSNAVSNTARAAVLPATKAIDVTTKKLVSMMNGTPTNATYKEVGAVVRGLWDALRGKKIEPEFFASTKTDKYGANPFDLLSEMAPTAKEAKAWKIAGKVIAYPEWAMRGPDIYAKNMIGLAEKYAAKARGEDLSKFATQEGIKDAQLKATFQDEMSRVGKIIARFRGSAATLKPGPATDAIDMLLYSIQPFVQTVDRIIGGGLKMSPAGWFNPVLQAMEGSYRGAFAKGAAHDPAAAARLAEDMAYIAAGLPLTMATIDQYRKDNLIGAQPTDPKQLEAFKTAGKIPYSFRLNGTYHPMRLLPEPAASGAQFTVAILDAMKEGAVSGQEAAMQLWQGMLHFGGVVVGKPYLGGLNSVLSSFSTPLAGKANPKTPLELPAVRKIGSAGVPSVVKDVAEIKDAITGTPRKMSDNLLQDWRRRSGQTAGMQDELNVFGEPLTYGMIGSDLAARDPKYKLLQDVPPPTLDRNMMGYELTQEEYHDLKQELGQQYDMLYSMFSEDPGFMEMPQGVKATILEPLIAEARTRAMQRIKVDLQMRDPMYANEDLRRLFELKHPQKEESTFPFPSNK